MKYSDLIGDWLKELGYTHCFYVAGGNIMHLLASMSERFTCISVIHEVAAGIATEYFNETSPKGRAFALVTAGPGLTNIVTAMAGAFLESRELLVLGGQVKTADLSRGMLRQRGIQEIAGVDIARPVTVKSVLLDDVAGKAWFREIVEAGSRGRKGPVFVEIPLDIQGRQVERASLEGHVSSASAEAVPSIARADLEKLVKMIRDSARPMLLLGGGVRRDVAHALSDRYLSMGIPVVTTWNGADRIAADHPLYFGRPNTWGQRYSNILLQQTDLLIALGTRLGLQQTGFNWQEFVPIGRVVQVDCDKSELTKGHPRVDWAVHGDGNEVLSSLSRVELGNHMEWVAFCRKVKDALPLIEPVNTTRDGYLSPYKFVDYLSGICAEDGIITPCSSGSAFTVMMQTFAQKKGQTIVTNKGLASMGYGLSGAIGSAFANPGRRVVLVEGDGGFAQNLQELGTVAINRLNMKIFIFNDNGYASIRMTQRNYFGGRYVGCDRATGLGLPDWEVLFRAFGIPTVQLLPGFETQNEFHRLFDNPEPAGFIVMLDPEQTYLPKIMSRVTSTGTMASNPLHLMSPDLEPEIANEVFRYLPN